MNAEVRGLLQKVTVWQSVALGATFLALVVVLGLVPRLAGGSYPPVALVFSGGLLLATIVGGWFAWSRARAAELAVTMLGGADSPVAWRMRRETISSRVWVSLAAIVILPGALMPKSWAQYPVAALVVGAACAVFAAVAIARAHRATEAYWSRLSGSALAAEIDQAWRQRFSGVLVLLAVAVGFFTYVYGGPMAPWTWPPSSELVLDLLVLAFMGLVLVVIAVNYLQLRRWWLRQVGAGTLTV